MSGMHRDKCGAGLFFFKQIIDILKKELKLFLMFFTNMQRLWLAFSKR